MKELLIIWILNVMTSVAPPHREHFEAEAKESYAQADVRYREIAEAIVDASFDENVQPAFPGPRGRASTAMLVATTFFMESGFRRDIDLGTSRARLRRSGLNDHGRSWCMGQINLGITRVPDPERPGTLKETSAATTINGWTGPELLADRRKCVAATINVLRLSMGACANLPPMERLAVYASGTCDNEAGRRASETRMRFFHRWLNRDRPAAKDAQVLLEMQPPVDKVSSIP